MIEDFPSNPYAPPEAPLEVQPVGSEGLRPLPFEDREAIPGFWRRVGGMFKLLFSEPYGFYDRMGVTTGLGAPLRFMLLLLVPLLALMLLIFGVMGVAAFFETGAKGSGPPSWMMPLVVGLMGLLYPLFIVIGTLAWGLLNHACLWMWRGTTNSAGPGQSIRVTMYTYAFILVAGFVPLVGLLAVLAGIVFMGIGLARIHRTEVWRGVAAVLTPMLLCCGLYAAFIAIAIASGGFK